MKNKLAALLFVTYFLNSGCSDQRSITLSLVEPPPTVVTYNDVMKSRFDANCIGCHSGLSAPGNYKLDTYAGIFGNGSDGTPNAIPGDSTCLLVTKVKNMNHAAWNTSDPDANTKIRLLIRWIVEDLCKEK